MNESFAESNLKNVVVARCVLQVYRRGISIVAKCKKKTFLSKGCVRNDPMTDPEFQWCNSYRREKGLAGRL